MSKIYVDFAPLTEVALVFVPGMTSPPCYAVSPEWDVREEHAPQMFNMEMDKLLEIRVEMEDEHPFPKVLERLKKRIALISSSEEHHILKVVFPPAAWTLMQEMKAMSGSENEDEVMRDALRLYHGMLKDKLAGAKIAIIEKDENTGLTHIHQY